MRNHTFDSQRKLASFCRTGNFKPVPGIHPQHIQQYRRLILNVVDDTLASAYPLTKKLLCSEKWTKLVEDFFSQYPCQSPQVWKMPKDLCHFLTRTDHDLKTEYPFLTDLLWFEWLEVELYMQKDVKCTYQANGNPNTDRLVLNPEHRLRHFNYPVHIKQASEITTADKGEYFLFMHRDPESGKVKFTDLSPVLALAMEILNDNPLCLNELAQTLSEKIQIATAQQLMVPLKYFVKTAIERKLIIGFIPEV